MHQSYDHDPDDAEKLASMRSWFTKPRPSPKHSFHRSLQRGNVVCLSLGSLGNRQVVIKTIKIDFDNDIVDIVTRTGYVVQCYLKEICLPILGNDWCPEGMELDEWKTHPDNDALRPVRYADGFLRVQGIVYPVP